MSIRHAGLRHLSGSSAALALLLIPGNLVFLACAASRHVSGLRDLSHFAAPSVRITVIGV